MIRVIASLLISISITISIGNARILNVPEEYETIQAGIDAAEDGDTVLVQPGRYDENILLQQRALVLASLTLTTGNPAYIDSTIIDGGDRDQSVVRVNNCLDSTMAITGFTITSGNVGGMSIWSSNLALSWLHITGNRGLDYGDSDFDDIGAGINCSLSEGSEECTIYLNHSRLSNNSCFAGGFGGGSAGGIKSKEYNLILKDVEIDHNEGLTSGGALFLAESKIILENVSVHDNTSRDVGGGISINCGAHVIGDDVRIIQNSARRDGGGCYAEGNGRFTLNRSLITGNSADRSGGGVSLTGNLRHTFTNCVIADNDAPDLPSICCYSRGGVELTNTIIYSASEQHIEVRNGQCCIAYCVVSGGQNGVTGEQLNWLEGNLDVDPIFIDPDYGDYHLSPDSPCIDAGDPHSRLDPDGTIADIGACFVDMRQDPPSIVRYFPEEPILDVNADDTLYFSVFAVDAEGDSVSYLWRLNGDTLSFDSLLIVASLDTGETIVECVVSDGFSANCHAWEVIIRPALSVPSDILHSSLFTLHSAFPNPFNATTRITFSTGRNAYPPRLAVYGIDGRLVADLSSAVASPQATGGKITPPTPPALARGDSRTVIWNAEGLPGGIYFVRLEAGNEVRTMKTLLMK